MWFDTCQWFYIWSPNSESVPEQCEMEKDCGKCGFKIIIAENIADSNVCLNMQNKYVLVFKKQIHEMW